MILAAVMLLTLVLFTGCGLGDKIGEQIGEAILEEATSGDVDVELDEKDGGVTITTSDGQMQTGTDLDWPADSIGDVPKIDANITGVSTGQGSTTVFYEEVKTNIAEYVETLKTLGYTNETVDMKNSDGSLTFTGTNSAGAVVGIFHSGDGTGWISYTVPTQSE